MPGVITVILTVDIGNSRIKWAQWQAEVIIARDVVVYHADKISEAFDRLFLAIEPPSQVFAVCVAGETVRQALSEWVRRHWQLDVQYLKTEKQYKQIINAYEDPESHGTDRWAAVIAGCQSFPGTAVCVISAGTAITFDLIDKNGRHLGGYILPSYVTMHRALLGDTANVLSAVNTQFDISRNLTIPNNTDDAVNAGLHRLLQAGIRELCQSARESVGGSMQIIVTGGFAKTILSYPNMPVMHHKPDLVMQGLYSVMKQRISGAES
jgi:type III pantothenate kinase